MPILPAHCRSYWWVRTAYLRSTDPSIEILPAGHFVLWYIRDNPASWNGARLPLLALLEFFSGIRSDSAFLVDTKVDTPRMDTGYAIQNMIFAAYQPAYFCFCVPLYQLCNPQSRIPSFESVFSSDDSVYINKSMLVQSVQLVQFVKIVVLYDFIFKK
ncbi:hypothetical protein RDT67_14470 [Serratia fonticola]|uniref:Uncharacterized protein n=1 Tax=Serratia fonticola TaxID=47917 RepID=A0AAJ1YCP8_SERFO|nr:hypothetical protein [Serratia fonticola]MDQ9127634.1 hypothetical protein [Serratia fonticola]